MGAAVRGTEPASERTVMKGCMQDPVQEWLECFKILFWKFQFSGLKREYFSLKLKFCVLHVRIASVV
jgi:hypothetical protein